MMFHVHKKEAEQGLNVKNSSRLKVMKYSWDRRNFLTEHFLHDKRKANSEHSNHTRALNLGRQEQAKIHFTFISPSELLEYSSKVFA